MTEQQQEAIEAEGQIDDTGIDDTDVELDDDSGGEGAPVDEWKPPTREEWEAAQAKLARARKQAQTLREKQAKASTAVADPEAQAAAAADLEKWQGRAVRQAARAELLARNADPDMVNLMLAALKPAEIEFDDNGDPDLADWADDMEERYAKAFTKQAAPAAAPAARPGRVEQAPAAARRPVQAKLSLGEQILANARRAQGGGRRG